MTLCTLGIDLAKNVFQICGVDEQGRQLFNKKVTRNHFMSFMAQQPRCLVGMETCGSANYFARELVKLGFEVKLIPAQYVKPYVKTNKTDAADAQAICEAVRRPTMRFAQIKTEEQQMLQSLHRRRSLLMKHKLQESNHVRGLLAEFGVIMPLGYSALLKQLPDIIEDGANKLPIRMRELVRDSLNRIYQLINDIKGLEKTLSDLSRQLPDCQRLMQIPGVGLLTATYMIAAVGNGQHFKSSRHFISWLGLTPKEHSSGGKQHLGGISKRGDVQFRNLLIHGARTQLTVSEDKRSHWLIQLLQRKPRNVAIVAQATKTARIMWSMLVNQTDFRAAPSIVVMHDA